MKLEQIVTSLEISKRLAELGVAQRSLFYWGTGGDRCEDEWAILFRDDESWSATDKVSAFTSTELGEILRTALINGVHADEEDPQGEFEHCCWSDKETDARGHLLIHLIETKLITF